MLNNFELTGTPGTYTPGFLDEDNVLRARHSDGRAATTTRFLRGTCMADAMGDLTPGVDVYNTFSLN